MKEILIIGPSIERTKGGIATVIQNQLNSNPQNFGFKFNHLVSHVEGSIFEKLSYFLKGIYCIIKKKNLSIVHIHVASDASFYRKSVFAFIAKLKKVPVIMHSHGCDFDDFYKKSNALSRYWIRKTFQSSKKVIVLSNYWQIFFVNKITNNNVEVLYNGVDYNSYNEYMSTSDGHNKFLFLGRLMKRKGIYDLLKAIDIIVNNKNYSNIAFYLGGDGDLDEVGLLIKKYNIGKYVTILGWLGDQEKKQALKRVSSVILPSYNEGLPMALLEAMACGKVIISSTVGGIPELVEEGKNGFLVSPGDIDKIVESILYITNNKKLIESISACNTQKIQDKYDLETLNLKLYSIYSSVLSY